MEADSIRQLILRILMEMDAVSSRDTDLPASFQDVIDSMRFAQLLVQLEKSLGKELDYGSVDLADLDEPPSLVEFVQTQFAA